jgi:methylmalonyl-CoA/ethylmalonyl-CoA epimerase
LPYPALFFGCRALPEAFFGRAATGGFCIFRSVSCKFGPARRRSPLSCENIAKKVRQKLAIPKRFAYLCVRKITANEQVPKHSINFNSLFAMKVSHIEHLGVAVKSLDEAIPYWENVLGLKCYAIEEVADQKVRTAFFMLGQTKIELLEPTSEDSTIAKFIENRGVGIHHMALACENIEEQLADAEAKGIRLIDKTPRKGAEGLTIAFLHPKSTQGILTELCENKNKK